jgi:hypothetical protein
VIKFNIFIDEIIKINSNNLILQSNYLYLTRQMKNVLLLLNNYHIFYVNSFWTRQGVVNVHVSSMNWKTSRCILYIHHLFTRLLSSSLLPPICTQSSFACLLFGLLSCSFDISHSFFFFSSLIALCLCRLNMSPLSWFFLVLLFLQKKNTQKNTLQFTILECIQLPRIVIAISFI